MSDRNAPPMAAFRRLVKSCIVLFLGRETKPRRILRGLASGYQICASPAENLGYLFGTAEPHLQAAIKAYVSPGDTVYDIGANIGYVSLSLAKIAGNKGRVIAFEPLPGNADLLRKTIKMNGLANIELFQLAASHESGEILIRTARNPSTASIVWHRNDPAAIEIIVRAAAIDDLVKVGTLNHPRFVKIDVEGAEGSVLKGMRETIAAARPVLFVECSELGRETAWNILRELEYRCQAAVTREWVDRFEDYRHSDFLWLPMEHAASSRPVPSRPAPSRAAP
jgi:FkbM family methyltransferase